MAFKDDDIELAIKKAKSKYPDNTDGEILSEDLVEIFGKKTQEYPYHGAEERVWIWVFEKYTVTTFDMGNGWELILEYTPNL